MTGRDRLEVERRAIDAQARAEGPHPQMILIELLAAGQRAPRDQLVDVGVAGVVADLLALQPRPGRRRDDLARLRDDIAEADLLVLLRQRQMGVLAARGLAERLPGLHRDLAVGLRRQHQDHFGGVDVGDDAAPGPCWRLRDARRSAALRCSTSCSVFQAMPLMPLPIVSISGPSAVKRS